jgi:hypothetical protein
MPMLLRKEGMKYLSAAVIAATTLSHATAAVERASDLPFFDVDKYCKQEADILDKDPTMIQVCLEEEQKSYDKLKQRWPGLDRTVKNNCQGGPTVSSSYYKLRVCIEHELKEDKELRDFKFRR